MRHQVEAHPVRLLFVLVAAALLAVACLAACSKSDPAPAKGLPSWASESTVTAQAKQVAETSVARDFQQVAGLFADGGVTADQLDQSLSETFDQLGAVSEYGDPTFLQGESKGRSYATVLLPATFENGSGEFRISFFEDGKLAGYYFVKS